jgi:small-conductance mechanosensitive channel
MKWNFPDKEFLRIEVMFIVLLALLVFITGYYQFANEWLAGVLLTLIFIFLYAVTAKVIGKVRVVQEEYEVTKTHLHITRKTKRNKVKSKIPLKQVHHHKLDTFFLGGYVVTKKGIKHLLFFNSKPEAEKFKKLLKKHLKKK